MTLIFNGVEIEDAKYNGTSLEKIICNGVTVWEKAAAETIFNVSKITSNVYVNSTTYNNCKFIGFNVTAGNSDAVVTYGGITKTVTANSSANITFGQYGADADDGTADTGNITFKNATKITGFTYKTSKAGTDQYFKGINSIIDWGGLQTIGQNLFRTNTSITSLNINGRISTIEANAFYGCTGLTSLTIGASVNSIADQAFRGTVNLARISSSSTTYPASGDCLLYNGTTLIVGSTNSVIPSGCTTIKAYVFEKMVSGNLAGSITLPTSVTTIETSAFDGSAITYMRTSATTIGSYCFRGCTSLTSLNLTGNIQAVPEYMCQGCTSLRTFSCLTSGITSIGNYAFGGCSSLNSITFPSTIQTIGNSAFSGCAGNSNTSNLTSNLTSIGNSAFNGWTNLTSIYIPSNVTTIGTSAFANTKNVTSINFTATNCTSSNMTVFGSSGISGNGITLTIGNGVKRIPDHLFDASNSDTSSSYQAPKITTVTFQSGSTCTTIGKYAFASDNRSSSNYSTHWLPFTSINLPNSITLIDDYAFKNPGISTITIPSSVVTIGEGAFGHVTYAQYTNVINSLGGSSLTTIGNRAFQHCRTYVSNLTMPANVTSIGQYALQLYQYYPDGQLSNTSKWFRFANSSGWQVSSDKSSWSSVDVSTPENATNQLMRDSTYSGSCDKYWRRT